jgi:ferrous iron transporter FeoB
MENKISLNEIQTGAKCIIVKVRGHGSLRHRLMEMGFVKGETVSVLKNAPLLDPIEYQIMSGHVSLRRSEAEKIDVVEIGHDLFDNYSYNGTIEDSDAFKTFKERSKEITVALVGNPNCGKTSFFNHATGLHEKVGNYSGVTVDMKIGVFHHGGYTINLVDLPGTYSITEYTPEELYVREYITKQNPDIVLNIVDASNLERNLYLTTQLIDMNVRMVMALNMYDEMASKGDKFDYQSLSEMLGFPIIPTTACKGIGVDKILQTIVDVYENEHKLTKHIHINYGQDIENQIIKIKKLIESNKDIINDYPSRSLAINLIEGNKITKEEVAKLAEGDKILKAADESHKLLEKRYNEEAATIFVNARYSFIRGALKETYEPSQDHKRNEKPYSIDKLLTHKWMGFPILLIFLWIMFQATFTLGAPLQNWLDQAVGWIGDVVGNAMPEGILKDLIVDGIIAGVGGVIVFLPNILILFLFISILEDTGYMARAAFIMDKLMHKIGLHGKSFIPFLIGFGCAVPAIMATRTLENRKDRILTIMGIPFMSCSARLPVYLLLVSAFFSKGQGIILLSIYLIGIVVAIFTALLLKNTVYKNNSEHFVMELPPYRIPTLRNTLIHMWDKSAQYLKKMGTVILAASIIIWALGYFPRHSAQAEAYAQQIEQVENNTNLDEMLKNETLHELNLKKSAALSENSYIGKIGHFLAPIVEPLGFDWKMGVSILTGLGAKEIVVSSMGVLYQADENADENSTALIDKLREQKWASGSKKGQAVFTPLVAYNFAIFILLYFPCIAALAAIKREAGGRWAIFSIIYNTTIAWLICFAIYQIGIII